MNSARITIAKIAALLALVTLPAFIWFGWWMLGVSVSLAVLAAVITPRGRRRVTLRQRMADMRAAIGRRIHPHSWRPR